MALRFISLIAILLFANTYGQEKLIYHDIKTDKEGKIISWYDDEPGKSFNHVINLVWSFWDTMRIDQNGLPYYMNHQVWNNGFNDNRGIGGDQLQMALSAWKLLYAYTGNEKIKDNMRFMADYYLSHSLSPESCYWPNIPFPYNTILYSGIYDGDMILGKGYTQPDKAGSFALELINLYKMFGTKVYLDAAIKIANTLSDNIKNGDENNSPLPFKVNVYTNQVGYLFKDMNDSTKIGYSSYTTNWAPTLQLFLELEKLNKGDIEKYKAAFNKILGWMKKYPMKNNKWGPFFEDVPGWSDTQINAMTFARFVMEHPELFPDWASDTKKIIDWVHKELGNKTWEKYGVIAINEQTYYRVPANSHTARQGADGLLYAKLSGDSTYFENSKRQLLWSTYMVDFDGKNRFPSDDIWLTDGYGDYIRHYLRAMAVNPELAPSDQDHLLSSTSIIHQIDYKGNFIKFIWQDPENPLYKKLKIYYRTLDTSGVEYLRLTKKPSHILLENKPLKINDENQGYTWIPMDIGGLLKIKRINGKNVSIIE
ncbi:MAG: hypothetical protein AB1521_08190 [Bacteroidota bacterium]